MVMSVDAVFVFERSFSVIVVCCFVSVWVTPILLNKMDQTYFFCSHSCCYPTTTDPIVTVMKSVDASRVWWELRASSSVLLVCLHPSGIPHCCYSCLHCYVTHQCPQCHDRTLRCSPFKHKNKTSEVEFYPTKQATSSVYHWHLELFWGALG